MRAIAVFQNQLVENIPTFDFNGCAIRANGSRLYICDFSEFDFLGEVYISKATTSVVEDFDAYVKL